MADLHDIIIVGGGASGLMAAIKGAEAGAKVAVVEKNQLCGRKILITGKGRCNLTNAREWNEFSTHIYPKWQFFKHAFYNFSNQALIDFFYEAGVPTVETQGARVYPESMSAYSVVDALVGRVKSFGVRIIASSTVNSIKKEGDIFNVSFLPATPDGSMLAQRELSSKAVIVATGGLSYPATGSTGDGYSFALSFGHIVNDCFPSLTALTPAGYDQRLVGIDLENIGLALYIDGNLAQMEVGDMSFTDGGIEGSLGFKVSRKAVKALRGRSRVEVVLDLKPHLSREKLVARIARDISELKWSESSVTPQRIGTLLRKLMPKLLIDPFLRAHPGVAVKNLPDALKEWRFKIVDCVGYRRAVITAGGVSLDEINQKTMESKLVGGLYFAGELIDLDADTGGYNLQIAFSTGALAAQSAAKKILKG